MTDQLPVRSIGIPWYRREDYPRILNVMEDAQVLPPTFDEWRKKAGALEGDLKRKGMVVVRAVIDAEEFMIWCRGRGLNVDAKARSAFSAEVAMREVKSTH